MKFRCERDALVEALGTAQRAVATKGAFAALSGVKLELEGDRLRVTGTDLDLFIRVETTVAGQSDGVVVIPAKLAADIVRSLEPGAVQVESDEEGVQITAGRSNFSLRTFEAGDFPRQPEPAERAVTLPAALLADALRQVVRAASTDIGGTPVITGVLLTAEDGGLRLVATDKYRLAIRDLPGAGVLADGQQVIVPARALGELQRLLASLKPSKEIPTDGEGDATAAPAGGEVTLRLSEQEATFEMGTTRITTRLIPGAFPDYKRLMPEGYPNRLLVAKEPLLEALRRVRLLVESSISSVRVQLNPTSITLTVANADKGVATEEVDAQYEGEELLVAFNPEFLIYGVEATTGDEVAIEVLNTVKPVSVKASVEAPGVGTYTYLIMPVRT